MNMAKLGIVSGAISGFNGWNFLSKINKMRATSYTLCVLDLWVSWNSSRHSFGFYIPLLTRKNQAINGFYSCDSNNNALRYCNDIILRIVSRWKFGKRSAHRPYASVA